MFQLKNQNRKLKITKMMKKVMLLQKEKKNEKKKQLFKKLHQTHVRTFRFSSDYTNTSAKLLQIHVRLYLFFLHVITTKPVSILMNLMYGFFFRWKFNQMKK
jgi:hypothetical protein